MYLTAEINGCCCLYLDCFDSDLPFSGLACLVHSCFCHPCSGLTCLDLLCFVRRLLVACLAPFGWQSITSTVSSPYPFKPLGTVRLRTYPLNDLEKSFLHRQGDKTIYRNSLSLSATQESFPNHKDFHVTTTSATAAPSVQTMSYSDPGRAAEMANYHRELAEFNQSGYRTTCATVAAIAGCFGCSGIPFGAAIVGLTTSSGVAVGATIGASLACFATSFIAMGQANQPSEPLTPNRQAQESAGSGG